MQKIAIVGAGLMGCVLALRLQQQGYSKITLLDKDSYNKRSSPANIAAGMLAGLSESIMGGRLIYQLGKDSIPLWSEYLTQINASHLLKHSGTLLIAEPEFSNEINHYLKKISFHTGLNNYEQSLNKQQLQVLEPELNFNSAYFLANEGVLNAPEVMHKLKLYLLDKVECLFNYNNGLNDTSGNTQLGDLGSKFDLVFDCRGMGAKQSYPDLRGIRGEIIRVYAPEVNLSRPVRLFHPRHNIYIAPYADNYYAIGATEIESLDYSSVSVRSCLELLTQAYTIHGGFAEARIVSMDSNCRPTLTDNLPQIRQKEKVIAINGLYRHGFLLAPTLAEEVAAYILTGKRQFPEIWEIN